MILHLKQFQIQCYISQIKGWSLWFFQHVVCMIDRFSRATCRATELGLISVHVSYLSLVDLSSGTLQIKHRMNSRFTFTFLLYSVPCTCNVLMDISSQTLVEPFRSFCRVIFTILGILVRLICWTDRNKLMHYLALDKPGLISSPVLRKHHEAIKPHALLTSHCRVRYVTFSVQI